VNIADVYNTLQTYLGSKYINDFTIYGRNFRVVAQADTAFPRRYQKTWNNIMLRKPGRNFITVKYG